MFKIPSPILTFPFEDLLIIGFRQFLMDELEKTIPWMFGLSIGDLTAFSYSTLAFHGSSTDLNLFK